MEENKDTIKIEVKLDAIRREVWWLSTFLVKIPLVIGAIAAVFWLSSQKDCSNSSQDSYDGGYDGDAEGGEEAYPPEDYPPEDEEGYPEDGDGGYDGDAEAPDEEGGDEEGGDGEGGDGEGG